MRGLTIFLFVISLGFSENVLSSYDNRFESTLFDYSKPDTTMELPDSGKVTYPAQAMIRSLVLPGWGQIYNEDKWWKPALFAGIEIAGIVGWYQWKLKAEDLRIGYEKFANQHWELSDWVTGTGYFDEYFDANPDTNFLDITLRGGSHDLTIVFEGMYYSSDTLATAEGLLMLEDGAAVLKNRDFYENIGKYDRFVAGWDDTWVVEGDTTIAGWWPEKRKIEDGYKFVIMTENKKDYLNQRDDANTYLNMASYAVSSIMLNHVVSALEAVFTAGEQNKEKSLDTSVGLMYNKAAPYGIGGVSFSMIW